MKHVIFGLVLTIALFFSACSNHQFGLEDAFEYSAPSKVVSTERSGQLLIDIEADVFFPRDASFSTVQIQKKEFRKKEIEAVMNYFQPNAIWLKQPISQDNLAFDLKTKAVNLDAISDDSIYFAFSYAPNSQV